MCTPVLSSTGDRRTVNNQTGGQRWSQMRVSGRELTGSPALYCLNRLAGAETTPSPHLWCVYVYRERRIAVVFIADIGGRRKNPKMIILRRNGEQLNSLSLTQPSARAQQEIYGVQSGKLRMKSVLTNPLTRLSRNDPLDQTTGSPHYSQRGRFIKSSTCWARNYIPKIRALSYETLLLKIDRHFRKYLIYSLTGKAYSIKYCPTIDGFRTNASH